MNPSETWYRKAVEVQDPVQKATYLNVSQCFIDGEELYHRAIALLNIKHIIPLKTMMSGVLSETDKNFIQSTTALYNDIIEELEKERKNDARNRWFQKANEEQDFYRRLGYFFISYFLKENHNDPALASKALEKEILTPLRQFSIGVESPPEKQNLDNLLSLYGMFVAELREEDNG
jgi:hypothetical protein